MRIFISYRREDSAGHAGRLFDHLSTRFGSQNIFMDIDTIQPGEDFRKAIEKAVGTCDVVLVMIGRQWLGVPDAQGRRRLDTPGDFVRAEIASGLANPQVRVIPVLVRDALMPGADELPDDIKELAWRNALELSDNRFQYDANKLIGVIEQMGIQASTSSPGRPRKFSAAKIVGISLASLGIVSIAWMILSGVIPILAFARPTPTNTFASTSTNIPATFTPDVATLTATVNALSPVITVQQYFDYINNAGIKDDLGRAWELLTNKLQCNPSDQCNVEHYKEFWWQFQVQYKLFDCGSNNVTAELIYYTRGGVPNPSRQPVFFTYELLEENGVLKLNGADDITGVSAFCELSVSFP